MKELPKDLVIKPELRFRYSADPLQFSIGTYEVKDGQEYTGIVHYDSKEAILYAINCLKNMVEDTNPQTIACSIGVPRKKNK